MKTPFAEVESRFGSPLEISYEMSKSMRTTRVGVRGLSRWTVRLQLCTEQGVSAVAEVKLCAVKLGADYREVPSFESEEPALYGMLEATFHRWNRFDYAQLIAVESITVAEGFDGLDIGPYFLATAIDELASDETLVLFRAEKSALAEVRAATHAGFKKLTGSHYALDCKAKTAGVSATAARIRKARRKLVPVSA